MSYFGSKAQAGVYQRIICQMPPHSTYVEPFFGSGQIFFRKRPAARNFIIDADRTVISRIEALTCRHPAQELALKGATVICGDALVELPKLSLPRDAVVYCDPPYLHSTPVAASKTPRSQPGPPLRKLMYTR